MASDFEHAEILNQYAQPGRCPSLALKKMQGCKIQLQVVDFVDGNHQLTTSQQFMNQIITIS